jgi:hypothetical protein
MGQQLAGGVPLAAEQHVMGARVEKDGPSILTGRLTLQNDFQRLQIQLHHGTGVGGHGLLDGLDRIGPSREAGDTQGQTVAEKDLGETFAN